MIRNPAQCARSSFVGDEWTLHTGHALNLSLDANSVAAFSLAPQLPFSLAHAHVLNAHASMVGSRPLSSRLSAISPS